MVNSPGDMPIYLFEFACVLEHPLIVYRAVFIQKNFAMPRGESLEYHVAETQWRFRSSS